jgi:hypothetical protein
MGTICFRLGQTESGAPQTIFGATGVIDKRCCEALPPDLAISQALEPIVWQ